MATMELHNMSLDSEDSDVEVACERPDCTWKSSKIRLLKHIGAKKLCKNYYGNARYIEMLRKNRLKSSKKYHYKHKEERNKSQHLRRVKAGRVKKSKDNKDYYEKNKANFKKRYKKMVENETPEEKEKKRKQRSDNYHFGTGWVERS